MPTPFINAQMTFRQPDGTEIEVRGTGNQYSASFETLDGLPITRDPLTGFYHVAGASPDGQSRVSLGIRANALPFSQLKLAIPDIGEFVLPPSVSSLSQTGNRWQQRRLERRTLQEVRKTEFAAAPAPPQRHTVGNFIGLTLLIDFPDVPATISATDVNDFCNQAGYTGFGNVSSVQGYFKDISSDRLNYTNIVAPYYTAAQKREYYTNKDIPYGTRAVELIKEALNSHLRNGFDFSHLTADDKQYIYALNVFYAGDRVNDWGQGLWPHSHYLDQPTKLAPGRKAYDYQVTNMGDELTLGTFCHENGHMICDFPDLYDYDKAPDSSLGVGGYCLMCMGGSNPNETNPAHVGAYLKRAAGWAESVQDLRPGATITLNAGRNEFAILQKSATEYFIMENRLQAHRDAGLPSQGLAIWHVDELGSNSHQEMTPSSHYECSLLQADGRFDLERNLNIGDAGDLYSQGHVDRLDDTTTPSTKWWDGSNSGLNISGIGPAGPVITFSVK